MNNVIRGTPSCGFGFDCHVLAADEPLAAGGTDTGRGDAVTYFTDSIHSTSSWTSSSGTAALGEARHGRVPPWGALRGRSLRHGCLW